jgi:hypothetical protein
MREVDRIWKPLIRIRRGFGSLQVIKKSRMMESDVSGAIRDSD